MKGSQSVGFNYNAFLTNDMANFSLNSIFCDAVVERHLKKVFYRKHHNLLFSLHQIASALVVVIDPQSLLQEDGYNLDAECKQAAAQWIEYQDGQRILVSTPSVLAGFRVKVYRKEGTTRWFTAVIRRYNDNTKVRVVSSYSHICGSLF